MKIENKEKLFKGDFGGAVSFDCKQVTEAGEFEGYASVFGEQDQGRDICVAGCFGESLRRRPRRQVKMLWQHWRDEPIGFWKEMFEDERGLRVKGQLILDVQRAREAHALMKNDAIDGLSIGYRVLEDSFDREENIRKLVKVDLREVSVVTFPMLESATVSMVKGNRLPTEREFETALCEMGFSTRQAKAITASGYKNFCQAERDVGAGGIRHAERDAGMGELSAALGRLRKTIGS